MICLHHDLSMFITKLKRIGILIDSIEDKCEYEICRGAASYFKKTGTQVVIFEGVHCFKSYGVHNQHIRTREMINQSKLDGLIIFTAFLNEYFSDEQLKKFIDSINSVPIVCLGSGIDGYSSITSNKQCGMEKLITHLIKDHRCRNFSFISDGCSSRESLNMFSLISRILKQNNIVFSEENIISAEIIVKGNGRESVISLSGSSSLIPDVIVCFDDYIAISVIDYLQSEGFAVPGEIIVTGFDDIREAMFYNIPLTTVKQKFYDMGLKAAAQVLVNKNNNAPESIVIDTEVVIRQSCGCSSHTDITEIEKYSSVLNNFSEKDSSYTVFINFIQVLLKDISESLKIENTLLLNLLYSIDFEKTIGQPAEIKEIISDFVSANNLDSGKIQELRDCIGSLLGILESAGSDFSLYIIVFYKILGIFDKILMTGKTIESYDRVSSHWKSSIESQIMLRSDSIDELLSKISAFLNEFSINSFFLFLYKPESIQCDPSLLYSSEQTELVFVFRSGEDILKGEKIILQPKRMLPQQDLFGRDINYIFFMLSYEHKPVGYIFMEYNPLDPPEKFGALRINMETAFNRISVLEESRNRVFRQEKYYLNIFKDLRNILTTVLGRFESLKRGYPSGNRLNSLGLNLNKLKDRCNYYAVGEEETFSYDHSENSKISEILSDKVSGFVAMQNNCIKSSDFYIQENIYTPIDSHAFEYLIECIFQIVYSYQWDNMVKVSVHLKACPHPELRISNSALYLPDEQMERITDSDFEYPGDNIRNSDFSHRVRIIRRILMQTGTSFNVENSREKGCEFILKFKPAEPDSVSEKKDAYNCSEKTDAKLPIIFKKILIIGNNVELRNFLIKQFSSLYETIWVKLDEFSHNLTKEVSLIILDIDNHKSIGLSFLDNLFSDISTRSNPVIMLSSKCDRNTKIDALSRGCADFLSKPFHMEELLLKIGNYMNIYDFQKNALMEEFEKSVTYTIENEIFTAGSRNYNIQSLLFNRYNLSKREIDIVKLMFKSYYHKQIAHELNISEQTVKNISHQIYKKCRVSGKKELVAMLLQAEG